MTTPTFLYRRGQTLKATLGQKGKVLELLDLQKGLMALIQFEKEKAYFPVYAGHEQQIALGDDVMLILGHTAISDEGLYSHQLVAMIDGLNDF